MYTTLYTHIHSHDIYIYVYCVYCIYKYTKCVRCNVWNATENTWMGTAMYCPIDCINLLKGKMNNWTMNRLWCGNSTFLIMCDTLLLLIDSSNIGTVLIVCHTPYTLRLFGSIVDAVCTAALLTCTTSSSSSLSSHFHQRGTPIFVIHCKYFTIGINSNRSPWNKSYKKASTETTNTQQTTNGWQSHFQICFPNWIMCVYCVYICIGHKYIYGWCNDVWTKEFSSRCEKCCFDGISHEQYHFQYSVRHMLEQEWFETRHHYSKLMSFSTILQMKQFQTCWSTQPTPADIPFSHMEIERKLLLVILIFESFSLQLCLFRNEVILISDLRF